MPQGMVVGESTVSAVFATSVAAIAFASLRFMFSNMSVPFGKVPSAFARVIGVALRLAFICLPRALSILAKPVQGFKRLVSSLPFLGVE